MFRNPLYSGNVHGILDFMELEYFRTQFRTYRGLEKRAHVELARAKEEGRGTLFIDESGLKYHIFCVEGLLTELQSRLVNEKNEDPPEQLEAEALIEEFSQIALKLTEYRRKYAAVFEENNLQNKLNEEAFFGVAVSDEVMPPLSQWMPQNWRFVTGPIRKTAKPVRVYNDGLAVFFYDKGRAEQIAKADPEIITGLGPNSLDDGCLKALFKDRSLVVSLLEDDGGVDIDVVVGRKLTKKELAIGAWLEPQSAVLDLPTGQLEVHSYNSLPLREGTSDEGVAVKVPKGTYTLTLYRKDWEGEAAAGRDWLQAADNAGIDVSGDERIDEVLVLTLRKTARGSGGVLFPELG